MPGSTGLHRQVLNGGLRIGLYDPVKRFFMGSNAAPGDVPGLHIKIAAGMTTGAMAILVASPTDLVKACRPYTYVLCAAFGLMMRH